MSFSRYPAYKDSGVEWLGEVPVHWEVVRLNTIATCNDEVLLESTPEDYEIEYVEISGVQAGQGIVETAALPFGNSPSRARRVVRDGDVLISTVRTYLRAIAQVKNPPENMIASTGFAVLRPRRIDSGFLGYACHAEGFVSEVIARSVGVSYPAINASELARLPLPLPTSPEQTAIANFIDHETAKIDALVAEQERLIELLKEKRQAVISHAVTKGLDPSVPMKDSGVEWLGEVPAHWEVMPLKRDIEFVTSGARGWAENYAEDGDLFIRIGNLTRDTIRLDLSDVQRVTVPDSAEVARTEVQSGDVLFSITAYLGSVAVVPPDLGRAFVSQHVALARPRGHRLQPEWIAYVTASHVGKTCLEMLGYGGTKVQLSLGDVANLLVTVPALHEQEDLVHFLDREIAYFDALTAEAQRAIGLLQERRTALITAAVTGQIDVRGFVPPRAGV